MTEVKPIRIQRKRTKGWRMPENTVYVGRGSKWGNPFRIGIYSDSARECVDVYEWCVSMFPVPPERIDLWKREGGCVSGLFIVAAKDPAISWLRGKNLACWCPLDQPCHADVLLELANK